MGCFFSIWVCVVKGTQVRKTGVQASLLGVGAPEVLVIGVVALLVFGPKGLAEACNLSLSLCLSLFLSLLQSRNPNAIPLFLSPFLSLLHILPTYGIIDWKAPLRIRLVDLGKQLRNWGSECFCECINTWNHLRWCDRVFKHSSIRRTTVPVVFWISITVVWFCKEDSKIASEEEEAARSWSPSWSLILHFYIFLLVLVCIQNCCKGEELHIQASQSCKRIIRCEYNESEESKEMKCVIAGGTHIGELIAGFSTNYPWAPGKRVSWISLMWTIGYCCCCCKRECGIAAAKCTWRELLENPSL